jgi:hypothetical protein
LEFGKSFGIPKVLEFHGIPMEYQSQNMKYLGMAHLCIISSKYVI